MKVILASQSPRRRELMALLRIPFSVQVADIDETMDPEKSPYDEVARVSRQKALAIQRQPSDIVIAADTVVVRGDRVLGKPASAEDAFQMLRLLSGGTHQVMTGLTVLAGQQAYTCTEVTDIQFCPLTDHQIRAYIATGEPMDKAGSYGIQGGAALFVRRIEGDYYNVVGLPVCRLAGILQQLAPQLMEGTE